MPTPDRPQYVYSLARPEDASQPGATGQSSALPVVLVAVAALIVPGIIAYGLGTLNELQVLAIVLGVLGVVAIVARPFIGLILFVTLLYTRPEEAVPALAGMHFTLLVALVTLGGMIVQMLMDRQKLVRTPLNATILGFFGATLVSASLVGTGSDALMDIGRLVMLVFLILNLVRTPQRYSVLVNSIIAFSSYLALYSSYLYFTGAACIDQGVSRSQGTGIFSDPNDLAATMTAGLALALTRVVQERGIARVSYVVMSAVMGTAIILTNSRGGLLAMIFMLAGFFIAFSRHKGRAVAVALAVAALVLVAAPGRMKDFDSKEESANSRFHFWEEGFTQLRLHPLTGVGYQKFPDVNGGFVAHNSFVHCFAELGLPGYFFWMGCVYFAFKRPDESGMSGGEGGIAEGDSGGNDSPTKVMTVPTSRSLSRELIGARLALAGYLAACFWITRTYTPVLFVLISLPVVQQLRGSGTACLAPRADHFSLRHAAKIGSLCAVSCAIIWLVVWKNV
jgi:putative inorganic carbon (hco3(-)) transporter